LSKNESALSVTSSNGTPSTNSSANNSSPDEVPIYDCQCEVEFSGLCPKFNPIAPVDEGQCEASNKPEIWRTLPETECKNQYDYLLAVVATNRDASYLLQLNSYQTAADISTYLSIYSAILFVFASSILLNF
jgi:hypothetical protein